jgi:P-type E1-E2 ATPase
VAFVAGLSRAAHFGVLIKGAKPLEALVRARTLILDKTGTLTDGRPRIVAIETFAALPQEKVLYLAAAADQASKHPMAQAIVAAARVKGMLLPVPTEIEEVSGEGIAARVGGHSVVVGGREFVMRRAGGSPAPRLASQAGSAAVAVAVDGQLAGNLVLADSLRSETAGFLAGVRRHGIRRILLATGDRRTVAQAVAEGLGLDGIRAELTPDQKVLLVLSERKNGPVMMVGDGVNDAPALAAADVGVAMGARGAAASSEAADVVLLVDDLSRLLSGLNVAGRARRIAVESVVAGISLSVAGMIAAALGYLNPVQGALLQEAIDVAVILNALRALRISPDGYERAGERRQNTAHLARAA